MKRLVTPAQHGYTLLELLLYITILGALLGALTMFFGTITDARVKNQSVAEVEQQGMAIMDAITQTVRTATAITSPATGASGSSLTLAMPTSSVNPTIFDGTATNMGYAVDGTQTDTSNSNVINATKFTATADGTISTLYAMVGPTTGASPNNLAQMALYSGASSPTTLLASSTSQPLVSNNWNTFPIPTTRVTSGTTYWIAYNTNGTASTQNDLRTHTGTTGQSRFVAQTFGTWPGSWTGTAQNLEYSMYAPIETGTASMLRIKEGASSAITLSSSDVQVTALSFKNLTRAGTTGLVEVSFTVSRYNPGGRPEYDFRKEFSTTVEVGW